jgi:hypothetical protein
MDGALLMALLDTWMKVNKSRPQTCPEIASH